MQRNPAQRPTYQQLQSILEDHDCTGTLGSFTTPFVQLLQELEAPGAM
jgi:hypothetical protein